MVRKTISQIKFEIDQIDQLFVAYADLLERVNNEPPNLVQITALASVLHSFYNGLENIFRSIAKGIDGRVPAGTHWHRELLSQVANPTINRGAVLSDETAQALITYLGFRHFYRHSYSFFLDWNELETLIDQLPEAWRHTKEDLQRFLNGLSDE